MMLLIRVWLCRSDWNGRKAWERLGMARRGPRDPLASVHRSYHVQMLSNRVCGLYRKSAGDPTGNSGVSTGSLQILQDDLPWVFWVMVE
jgi:hypothetical protein